MGWIVYSLCHPLTGEVRYVGFTARSVSERMREHRSNAKRGSTTHLYTWWRSLYTEPSCRVIDAGSGSERDGLYREQEIISLFRLLGANLCNHTDGGEGCSGYSHSSETRKKIGQAHKGRKQSHEWVDARMKSLRGRTRTDSERAAISEGIRKSGSRAGRMRRISDQEVADIRATFTGGHGEISAISSIAGWSVTTIKRALDASLWDIPQDVIGHPLLINPHEKWFGENHPSAKTTLEQVREIRRRYDSGERCVTISEDMGIRLGRVQKIAYRDVFKDCA